MMDTSNYGIARLSLAEARKARLGEGHWSGLSVKVRMANARSYMAQAAAYRRLGK